MALLRLLFGTEHKDRGRRTVSCQMVPSHLVDRWCCFWSQYLVVLIGQQDTKNVYIRSTSPVAVVFFVTRHSSWAVHEHERTHEDVFRVGKTAKIISLGDEADRRLVEFHPARTGRWWRFVSKRTHCCHYDNHQEFEFHFLNFSWVKILEKREVRGHRFSPPYLVHCSVWLEY